MAFDPKDPKENRIDDLERDLYSRDAPPITNKPRPALSVKQKLIDYGWVTDKNQAASVDELTEDVIQVKDSDKKGTLITKVFLTSVLFFVISAAIAAYVILGGFNIISSKNVDISVQGPIALAAGEQFSLDVIIKNNNNSAIDSGNINIEYPDGTTEADDVTKEMTHDQIDLGSIPAGGSTTKTIKGVLFGEKDSVKNINITVEYQAHGSNASFTKEKSYDITINSSPIVMNVSVPQEVNAGQDISITVDVASNSNTLIHGLLVQVDYPFGFTFTGATPQPTFDKNIWQIGDFSPKEKQTIVINGRMDGQNEDQRTFRFETGTTNGSDKKQIAVNYITTQQSLAIKKPFITLGLQLGGQTGDYVVSAGNRIQGVLTWTNNLPIAINDGVITLKLSGTGLDRTLVSQTSGGFFRSVDNTITWDKNSLPDLQNIQPGAQGSVGFNIAALPATPQLLSSGRNMNIAVDATVAGTRIQEGVPQSIQSSISGQTKVVTNLALNSRMLHSTGPFANGGSLPPRAEKETAYTVVLDLSNSFNDLADVSLTTVLPPYVRWIGAVSPSTEPITYNASNRTVTWSVQDLRAGVGYANVPKEVAFQVAFLPSLSQVGTVPDLTGTINVTGTDRFTGTQVQVSNQPLSTRLNDPGFRNGDEKVTQ